MNCQSPDEFGNITISSDQLPEGSIGRRLAAFLLLHSHGEECFCEPIMHRTPDGTLIFMAHNIIVETKIDV